ncbi:MAG: hypothetical protein Ta2F_12680 [Termitinemataceae bacterium]|nr:MAG: hypothetical protein Ta2F_12680 [Termitinemataceae bacterium]
MKKFNTLFGFPCAVLACVVLFICLCSVDGVFADEQKHKTLGGAQGWEMVKYREQVTYLENVRPKPVLSLSSAQLMQPEGTDLVLTFDEASAADFRDETGNYRIVTGSQVSTVPQRRSRIGRGAALFSGDISVSYSGTDRGPVTIWAGHSGALFSAGRILGSFSIEFWLYPNSMESGEEIITWTAAHKNTANVSAQRTNVQSFNLSVYKNRLHWNFVNFFAEQESAAARNIVLSAKDSLAPKTWSHHILRYDGERGLLEYVINGITQEIKHVTVSGREGSEVLSPVIGERGNFLIGKIFNGMLDDFKIYSTFLETSKTSKYPNAGGRLESDPVDLENANCAIQKINVSGGRVNAVYGGLNEYQKNGLFKFSDDSQVQFFLRTSNSQYDLVNQKWQVFTPGASLNHTKGRYVQLAADLYPSGNCENTPYIEEITIVYTNQGIPKAPQGIIAAAGDGSVRLSWKNDNGPAAGYVVYYGTSSGYYFCSDALQGTSPIDAGKTNSIILNNLKNGTLYYFAVCAYNNEDGREQSGFSREVSARPLWIPE